MTQDQPAFVLLTVATAMFDSEVGWHFVERSDDAEPIYFGRELNQSQLEALETGLVVAALMRYPRVDAYGMPDEATAAGMRHWVKQEMGFNPIKPDSFEFSGVEAGDDTPARCVLTIRIPVSNWPLDVTKFEDFAKLVVPGQDINRFADCFSHAVDINGALAVDQLGFHFCLDEEDEPDMGYTATAKDIFDTFEPALIFVGTKELQDKLLAMGRQSIVHSYYEDGGLAVVLRVPYGTVLYPQG